MSSLSSFVSPIPVGKADSASQWSSFLGKTFEVGGAMYRLVQTAAAITAAANKVLVTATSGQAPTWVVNTTTTAASPLVAGVVPAGQTGSDGSTGLLSGDYFLIQISGVCTPIVVTGALAAGTALVTSTTAGSGDGITIAAGAYTATAQASIFATLLVASTAATASGARLTGLI